jgi:hypothetical protein
MKIKHLLLIGALLFSSLASYGQILENTIVNHGNLIIAEKVKGKVNLNFSQGDSVAPYCLIPYNYKRGAIILPKDRNGNVAPASCKYVTESNKKVEFDPKDQFENRKYDGVFLFSKKDMTAFNACLGGVEHEFGYTINDYCFKSLKNIHSIALRKKRRLNVSSKELYMANVSNSARETRKETSVPYSPQNIGLSFGSSVIGY